MRFEFATVAVAALAALPAGINASPVSENDLVARASTCVTADVNVFKSVSKHPLIFCEWWPKITRTHSPMERLSVVQINNVCKCLSSQASKRDLENEKSLALSKPNKRAVTCAARKQQILQDWAYPAIFCRFWQLAPRGYSPFPSFTVDGLTTACKCALNQATTTTAAATTAYASSSASATPTASAGEIAQFKAIASKPYVFCDWWKIVSRPNTPSRTLTLDQMNRICNSLNAQPQSKKMIAAERASSKSSKAVKVTTSCSSADEATFDADWNQPIYFCNFWQSADRYFTPFSDLALNNVNAVCECKLGQVASTTSSAPSSTYATDMPTSTDSATSSVTSSASSAVSSASSVVSSFLSSATSMASSATSSVVSSTRSSVVGGPTIIAPTGGNFTVKRNRMN